MKKLNQVELSQAESAFMVANTPLFLVRKLRDDLNVLGIHAAFTPEQILDALKSAVRKKPNTLQAAVRPYVYLVALSLGRNILPLKQAAKLPARDFDWFKYIATVLIETHHPTIVETIAVPGQIGTDLVSTNTETPAQKITITVNN